ncbi:uncharacterized protein LOC119615300 [Lucilia sericata]|uniref:uncharacterized protein LOC119615300 n=1 Tax=Lucilia sericata TaxID=13632 RepID=UPI0018A80E24|nr:uncharacterized protein LOC119615300 [Lucilia sericata]
MFNNLKFVIILLLTKHSWGNNYIIVADENSFFQPCSPEDNAGNTNMEDLLELNLKHDFAEDMETLITNGNITTKVGIPEGVTIELDVEIFHWKRGKWEKTVYSIRRDDFCTAAFDPAEFWYILTNQMAQEDRVCPPQKGTVYHLNNVENRVEFNNAFGLDIEGDYKIISHFCCGQLFVLTPTNNISI